MQFRYKLSYGLVAALALLSPFYLLPSVQAQDGPWSPPTLIHATEGDLALSAMSLVVDQAGGVHLFFPHQPESDVAIGIDYLHWDGETWLGPYSVMVNDDDSNVGNVRAAIDSEQNIHLIWGGGRNRLYYASAPAVEAANALSWSEPISLGAAITEAGIAVAPEGTLVVAFSDADAIGTVSVTISNDGGQTWSTPTTATVTAPGIAPASIGVVLDDAGMLHLTWTGGTLPSGYPLVGVYYARSLDSNMTWSEPLQVDDEHHGEIQAFVINEDEIHLVWRSNIGGDGTFHQWSPDGGSTWSTIDRYDDRGGMSGLPSFAVDSVGALHYVIGSGYVTTFLDGPLDPYIDVVGGALREIAGHDPRKSAGERAVMAITTGNHLHVVFETNFNKLWHSQRQLDVPEIAPLPLSSSPAKIAATIPAQDVRLQTTTTPKQTLAEKKIERLAIDTTPRQTSTGMVRVLLISIGPAVILVGLVVLLRTRRTLV